MWNQGYEMVEEEDEEMEEDQYEELK